MLLLKEQLQKQLQFIFFFSVPIIMSCTRRLTFLSPSLEILIAEDKDFLLVVLPPIFPGPIVMPGTIFDQYFKMFHSLLPQTSKNVCLIPMKEGVAGRDEEMERERETDLLRLLAHYPNACSS